MSLKLWRFITIMLVALSMCTAFSHLMEMPPKLRYDGAMWLTLLQSLYSVFGTVGAFFEVGALVTTVVLAFMVRRRHPAFEWTLIAAFCLVAVHAAYWVLVAPVNATMVPLTPDTLPPNWSELRNQWEYTHGGRAVLQIVALGALVWSILAETTPAERHPPRR